MSLRPYQIQDEAIQDWEANVNPLKAWLIFNKIFLNVVVSMTEFDLKRWNFVISLL